MFETYEGYRLKDFVVAGVHCPLPIRQGTSGLRPFALSNATLVLGDWPSSPLPMPIVQYRIEFQGKNALLWTKPWERP